MERTDRLNGTDWLFYYDDSCFPPGTDSFLLSSLPHLKPGLRVLDLGAGSGLLGMLLCGAAATLPLQDWNWILWPPLWDSGMHMKTVFPSFPSNRATCGTAKPFRQDSLTL